MNSKKSNKLVEVNVMYLQTEMLNKYHKRIA